MPLGMSFCFLCFFSSRACHGAVRCGAVRCGTKNKKSHRCGSGANRQCTCGAPDRFWCTDAFRARSGYLIFALSG